MLESQLGEEIKMFHEGLFSPYMVAQTCSLLGHKREAIEYLQAAYERRSDGLYSIMNDSTFNPLHRTRLSEVGHEGGSTVAEVGAAAVPESGLSFSRVNVGSIIDS